MARADLLVNLVEAARRGDESALGRTVEALIAEERDKQHHVLAERLEDALRRNGGGPLPSVGGQGTEAVQTVSPRKRIEDLLLPGEVVDACKELIEEQQRAELLRSYALEPRHRVLLTGPPGNGKSSLAEALAEALLVPLFRVRYEAVVGSYLGETAAALARVFALARTRRVVLLFDEFDAIAKERGDEHETGEIKRVVSSLLMQIDELPSHVVVVGASNHPELLDRAAGRRFQLKLELPEPDLRARTAWFERFLASLDERAGRSAATLAKHTTGASFSELEDLTLDVRRRMLLDSDEPLARTLDRRVAIWRAGRRSGNG